VERGVVRIRKNGVASTLDFDNNGLAYSGPAIATLPGALGARPGRIPAPGQARMAVPTPNAGGRVTLPAARPSASVNVPGGGASATGTTPQVIPARAIRTAQQPMPEAVDPEVQLIQLRAQQMHAENEGRQFPPLPPVPMLQDLGEE
jgi:hypothetical protein